MQNKKFKIKEEKKMENCIICGKRIEKGKSNSITPPNFVYSKEEYEELIKNRKSFCCNSCNKLHIGPLRAALRAGGIAWNDYKSFNQVMLIVK